MSYQEYPLVTADNHSFKLQWFTAKSPKAAILLSPAMGVPAGYYKKLASALADQGFTCVITEHRGISSSSIRASRSAAFGYREMLEHDMSLAFRTVQANVGGLPIFMMGHSLGGQLSAMFTAMRPHDITGMILVASGSPYYVTYSGIGGVGFRLIARSMRAIASLRGHFPGKLLGFGGRESKGVIADWCHTALTGKFKAKGLPVNFAEQFQQIKLPVLAINIKGDNWARRGHVEQLLAKLKNAKVTRWVLGPDDFDGAPVDHFTWARQPKKMAAHLINWLGDQLPQQVAVAS